MLDSRVWRRLDHISLPAGQEVEPAIVAGFERERLAAIVRWVDLNYTAGKGWPLRASMTLPLMCHAWAREEGDDTGCCADTTPG